MKLNKSAGLTFIELMIAASIFAVVAVAVYSTFGTGIFAWRRAQESQNLYQDIRFALDKIAADLKNAVLYSQKEDSLNFKGEKSKLSFYSVAEVFQPAPAQKSLRKITYTLDEDAQSLLRLAQTYPESCQGELPAQSKAEAEKIARQIGKLDFSYYYVDRKVEPPAYKWKDNWNSAGDIPMGVKIEIEHKAAKLRLTKYVFIPTGKEGEEE